MKKFKELYQDEYNYDSDGEIESVKTINRMGRWTDDETVKEYLR